MLNAMVNSEYMVPCVKEETEEEVSIAHHLLMLQTGLSIRKTSRL